MSRTEPVSTRVKRMLAAGAAAALFVAMAASSRAEPPLDVKLHSSGMVEIVQGSNSLATIDLNAHSAAWEYTSQKDTKDKVSVLPGGGGKRFEGAFAIPKTEGAAVQYTQNVRMLPEGFELEYDLVVSKTVKLNGLQVSISLPVTNYAGKEMLVSQLGSDPTLVGLPKEHQEGRSQLWTGEGARVEVAKGTDRAIKIAMRAVTDILVQDLRQWQSPLFEVRFPAIMDNAGRELQAGTRFHLDITVTLGAPVRLVGP
jgi:hypothetical protein